MSSKNSSRKHNIVLARIWHPHCRSRSVAIFVCIKFRLFSTRKKEASLRRAHRPQPFLKAHLASQWPTKKRPISDDWWDATPCMLSSSQVEGNGRSARRHSTSRDSWPQCCIVACVKSLSMCVACGLDHYLHIGLFMSSNAQCIPFL